MQRPIQIKTRRTTELWVHLDWLQLSEVRHLVLVWERNLIISRRIGSLVHDRLLLWPEAKLFPHHFSYLRSLVNLLVSHWYLLRRNNVCWICCHCRLWYHRSHRPFCRWYLMCLLSHPIGWLLSHHQRRSGRRLWSWWTSWLLTSRVHVWHVDISKNSSCLIMENRIDSTHMRRFWNQNLWRRHWLKQKRKMLL